MELQSGAIVIIIILLSFVLISYAIYLIYNENKLLKGKLNELYNNMNNLETNIKNIFTQEDTEIEHDHDEEENENESEESEEDLNQESGNESDDEEITFETYNTTTNKPSFEMFGNSSEELEYLKQIQNTIQQGNKIEEIPEDTEETEEPEEVSPEIKINIPSKNKKCTKILTHGKRKDQECNRPVSDNNDVCKLHLNN